jgi:hypothetical protein
MLNFRDFQAGPDPFGRSYQVLLKWMQTAISIRHSDTVDVKFLLRSGEESTTKTIAMGHADLVTLSRETGHELSDPWCSRLAAHHLLHLVETGEDLEKDLVTVSYTQLAGYAAVLDGEEKSAVRNRGAA